MSCTSALCCPSFAARCELSRSCCLQEPGAIAPCGEMRAAPRVLVGDRRTPEPLLVMTSGPRRDPASAVKLTLRDRFVASAPPDLLPRKGPHGQNSPCSLTCPPFLPPSAAPSGSRTPARIRQYLCGIAVSYDGPARADHAAGRCGGHVPCDTNKTFIRRATSWTRWMHRSEREIAAAMISSPAGCWLSC